ncbi:MAG: hypothetical protein ACTHMJ_03555, partial [Thermomicrobiales bacterium]
RLSRLTLAITQVHAERLQDISDGDLLAEGIDYWYVGADQKPFRRRRFKQHWDALNGRRGFPWENNPWVWAVSFRIADPCR